MLSHAKHAANSKFAAQLVKLTKSRQVKIRYTNLSSLNMMKLSWINFLQFWFEQKNTIVLRKLYSIHFMNPTTSQNHFFKCCC